MEKIYPPSQYKCTKPIELKKYFAKCYKLLEKAQLAPIDTANLRPRQANDAYLTSRGITDPKKREELHNLFKVFEDYGEKKKKRRNRNKNKPKTSTPEPGKSTDFHTVRVMMENLELRQRWSEEPILDEEPVLPQKSETKNIEPGKQFAAAIRVYHPMPTGETPSNIKFSHEIVVLGSNTLADLRDKIHCRADFGLCVEVEDPTAKLSDLPNPKEKYPSGFIFIDNVFYNDMRHPSAKDYSKVIRDWAANKDIKPLSVGDMATTRIDDLSPRFGYPYLYQHQADCEHIITFSIAWVLSSSDPLNTRNYPYISSIQRVCRQLCSLCHQQVAEWLCYNCDRLPHTESLVCQECLLQYNYKNGEKVGDFKLYRFYDETYPINKSQ